MRNKLSLLFLGKYVEVSGPWENWIVTLRSLGCEIFPYWQPQEDTQEYIFVRDVAMGNIRVPREVAMRMLVLGELP